jgi:hypothetical protein
LRWGLTLFFPGVGLKPQSSWSHLVLF